MDDLIKRQDAIDACLNGFCACVSDCVDEIEKLPSAELNVPDINVGDMINRQDAIDILNKLDVSDGVGISSVACYLQEEALRSIENLPSVQSAQKTGKWIPCLEKLPSNDDFVIVTVLDERGDTPYRYSDFGWYLDRADCWIIDAEQRTDVIAWMPLPEPYEENES